MSEEPTPHFHLLSMEAFRELTVVERAEYLRRAMDHKKLLDAQILAAAEARMKGPDKLPE